MNYSNNKDFIFTIFDDTDVATLENISPIYNLLYDLGLLTTKSVWPLHCSQSGSDFTGSRTLGDEPYAEYIKLLSERGFEIAFHGASMESSPRENTLEALEIFHDILGQYPQSYACHAGNKENIHWGDNRFSFALFKQLYRLLSKKGENFHQGDDKLSKYFWGDICYNHIEYARTFTYNDINLKNITKNILYSSNKLPYFKSCFISNDADNVEEFNYLLREENQEKLERQRGICILTTHFGKGFVLENGNIHPQTIQLLEQLSKRNGWFVPVSTVLNFLKNQKKTLLINNYDLFKLEMKWFSHSLQRRFLKKEYHKTELEYLSRK